MDYFYEDNINNDLQTLMGNIRRIIGVSPTGASGGSAGTSIDFASELTPEQKTALDNFMAGENRDVIPVNTYTKYILRDIWSNADSIRSTLGRNFHIYKDGNDIVFHFDSALTSTQRTAFVTQIRSLLTQI